MRLSKHPKELWILALSELCERFAFWGVGNLLVLYLLEYYQFAREDATHIYGIFSGSAAFLPLIGGWIADRWNYQSPLLWGAVFNAVGCLLLAAGSIHFLFPALILIACGYGIFTPSILTLLSFSYRNSPSYREAGFSIYYASINIGVFLALATLGTIAKWASWNWAFFTAACIQGVGLVPIFWYLARHKAAYQTLKELQTERRQAPKHPLTFVQKERLQVIAIFCAVSILFWMAYNQSFSSIAIFVHSYTNLSIGSFLIPEGLLLSTQPFFLLLLAPLLATLYGRLQRYGRDPGAAAKTSLGLFAIACSFLVMAWAASPIPAQALSASISPTYVMGAYFLIALGEMLLAPIGLSLFSRLSPPRYTALTIGIWYVCVGFAFYNGGLLAGLMDKMGSLFNFFALFVALTLAPAVLLALLKNLLNRKSHLQADDLQCAVETRK
jgi:POT family proton-dependent oligopeptide transporter